MSTARIQSLPHLSPGEVSLLDLAADDPRDVVSLSDKEALILQLYNQIQELELEKAVLEQELEPASGDNADEQLAIAERELLEARATYTVRRKAISTLLMTDPSLKAVHLKAISPAERALLPLVNRRDVLSLTHENLMNAHNATLRELSNVEVQNLQLHQKNQELVRQLPGSTKDDDSWREALDDDDLKAQLEQLDADRKKSKSRWEVMKSIASAIVVGSGVNWAEDDELTALVIDESDN
ncbi:hypothetical protein ALT_1634 [Aspergillus lentulus]|uniref:Centromere protein H C-terminal domain-containing protein n=1 Tax=Aspergillus lentulus TaxID=293939 RepID=A0AAN4T7S2_ASPLE|nr:uncharacterized protein IFM58399_07966 [Aspergillus lentulus]KAF4158784.1 hypothetical protein CNMCM6069_003350 [Aspergillus lentulus]KAF4162571.1 hypothetical protein CNMCM6936_001949 [Aspergillus lentulus]KAF4173223.1 hypothetical protein CNMCM8060_000455 [Aspergillus lentulus]KAF4183626.1 hypothetical protein CNMCM7927_008938 [Aspergillus lentulus]KAF4196797.1 hypothetical protein CNMCM8694_004292 [Aspergillus lentulus]